MLFHRVWTTHIIHLFALISSFDHLIKGLRQTRPISPLKFDPAFESLTIYGDRSHGFAGNYTYEFVLNDPLNRQLISLIHHIPLALLAGIYRTILHAALA